jgi:hypothetical protein
MFESFVKQDLKLIKKDGSEVGNIKASVQEKICIDDIKLPIEEGDVFEYVMPSGIKQRLLVVDVILYNMGSHLDHYEIEFEKIN